jgi:hypothetical protein
LLPEPFGELAADEAREQVGSAPWREPDDDAYRPCRVSRSGLESGALAAAAVKSPSLASSRRAPERKPRRMSCACPVPRWTAASRRRAQSAIMAALKFGEPRSTAAVDQPVASRAREGRSTMPVPSAAPAAATTTYTPISIEGP